MKKLAFNKQYTLYSDGSLVSTIRGVKTLKPCDNGLGYKQYYLKHEDGSSKWYKVHRLVAEYYVPNPNGYSEVNHIDGDKSNNDFTNLEWCTHAQNVQHSYAYLNREVKRGEAHHLYGKKQSDATKAKQSESKIGEKHPKFSGYYVHDGIKYASSRLASQASGLSSRSIIRYAKQNINGWSFLRS